MSLLKTSAEISPWLDQLAAMDSQYFDWPWTRENWQAVVRDHQVNLLLLDGDLFGFCLFHTTAHDDVGHLLKILIQPSQRTRGLGRELLLQSVKTLPAQVERIYLEVSDRNQVAVNFYKRLGFNVLHHKTGFYSDGAGAYSMGLNRKDLST